MSIFSRPDIIGLVNLFKPLSGLRLTHRSNFQLLQARESLMDAIVRMCLVYGNMQKTATFPWAQTHQEKIFLRTHVRFLWERGSDTLGRDGCGEAGGGPKIG